MKSSQNFIKSFMLCFFIQKAGILTHSWTCVQWFYPASLSCRKAWLLAWPMYLVFDLCYVVHKLC